MSRRKHFPHLDVLLYNKTNKCNVLKVKSFNSSFMKNILIWLITLLPASDTAVAQTPVQAVISASPSIHAGFDSLLQKNVSESGKVNYKGFIADKAALDAYLQLLSENMPADGASREEKMTFWINAYNAFTIDLIARNYPTTSILKFDNGKTWDVKRIKLGGKKYSLNQIENEILRPQFKDARIHFAVNCAAQSCPPLYNHAFEPGQLDSLLDVRTRQFVNDKKYNALSAKSVKVSKIFEWYAGDFGNLIAFLNKYSTVKIGSKATVVYNEYDWELND